MAQEKTEAIVLRGVDYSETSRILTLLTPDRGKIGCLARGVRRKNSALAPVLNSYNLVELVYAWKDGRGVQNLVEASLLEAWLPMKRDLESGAYASFLLEFALKTVHENEPSEALFEMMKRSFAVLNTPGPDARVKCCWSLLHLLRIAGFEPHLEDGLQCSERAGTTSSRPGAESFPGCQCHRGAWIGRSDLEALRRLAGDRDGCPEAELSHGVLAMLARFTACQLETEFRSMRVIEKVLA